MIFTFILKFSNHDSAATAMVLDFPVPLPQHLHMLSVLSICHGLIIQKVRQQFINMDS